METVESEILACVIRQGVTQSEVFDGESLFFSMAGGYFTRISSSC
jgi:hypothetical protein